MRRLPFATASSTPLLFYPAPGRIQEALSRYRSGITPGAVVLFAIGQALEGHVNQEARTIFNDSYVFSLIDTAKQAIAFYEAQTKATKDGIRAWTQVGIKLKVVKDVRKLIAKLIWDSREEALYDVPEGLEQEEEEEREEQEPQPSARALRAQKRARK